MKKELDSMTADGWHANFTVSADGVVCILTNPGEAHGANGTGITMQDAFRDARDKVEAAKEAMTV